MSNDIDWKAATEDAVRRLARCHDDADRYQIRALAAEMKIAKIQQSMRQKECECECSHVGGHTVIGYDEECGPFVCLHCRIAEVLRS